MSEQSNTEKLKSCPFCGSEAKEHDGSLKDCCLCDNDKCIMFARVFYIKQWNTRSDTNNVEKALELVDGIRDRINKRLSKANDKYCNLFAIRDEVDKLKALLSEEGKEKAGGLWSDNKTLTEEQKKELMLTMNESKFKELYCLNHEPEQEQKEN